MRLKTSLKTVFVPALVLAIAVTFLSGCKGHCKGKDSAKYADKMVEKISKKLELNDTQKTKLQEIKGELLSKKAELKGFKHDLYSAVLNQAKSESVDEAALNATIEEKEAKMKEVRVAFVKHFAEFHATLNPEQKTKLTQVLEKWHSKHRKKCGRHKYDKK